MRNAQQTVVALALMVALTVPQMTQAVEIDTVDAGVVSISSPTSGQEVSGTFSFDATFTDAVASTTNTAQFQITNGNCESEGGEVMAGSVINNAGDVSRLFDFSTWDAGDYCYRLKVNAADESEFDAHDSVDFTVASLEAYLNITYPNVESYELSGDETLIADFTDDDETVDDIEWTVYEGTCDSEGGAAVAGNTDGFTDEYAFGDGVIEMYLDTTELENGDYCLQVDPVEQEGESKDIYEQMDFIVSNRTYTVTGTKYEDVDKNGAYDYEVDIVTVADYEIIATEEESGDVVTTTTDEEGNYEFELPAGTWTITEGTEKGWKQVLAFERGLYVPSEDEPEIVMSCTFSFGREMKFKEGAYCNFLNVHSDSSRTGTKVGVRGGSSSKPAGQVLGAATTTATTTASSTPACQGMYLTSYLRMGQANPADQVLKLQVFLKALGYEVATTGIFDETTEKAVRAYQVAYLTQVLTPWKITSGTGYVYKTTRATINNMVCPGSEVAPQI